MPTEWAGRESSRELRVFGATAKSPYMTQNATPHSLFETLTDLSAPGGGKYYSLPQLEKAGVGNISRLPVSIRIVLESVLRNYDGKQITEDDVRALANWAPNGERTGEIPFVVARVLLQDLTGVPLLVDLAAMRSKVAELGKDPNLIEPLVPVDLVVDHSIQVDVAGVSHALTRNMEIEFQRNRERYQFLKWGMQAFDTFKVIPPGIGICHQVNLEYLAPGVLSKNDVVYPDTLVGTDSHTTMINGLGIVGWGVGGIEAEAGMLGQPIYFLTPDVVGVHLTGTLPEGATATDMVLRVTELLRQTKVVGKFVEYFGEGASKLSVQDRATISNMSPEYGATMGFFPVDEQTCTYLEATGRPAEAIERTRAYFQAQEMFGIPAAGDCDYSQIVELDLSTITPAVAGPRRPQDRIEITHLKERFDELLGAPLTDGGWNKSGSERGKSSPVQLNGHQKSLSDGDVGDCCDHVVHEHLEPERDARGRIGGEEGGREGPHRSAHREGLPRARLARRLRLPREDRPAATPRHARLRPRRIRLYDVHRQLRPARPQDRRDDRRERRGRRERAVRQPQLRGAGPPEGARELPGEPTARRGVRARGYGRHRPLHPGDREGFRWKRRHAEGHLAFAGRDSRLPPIGDGSGDVPTAVLRLQRPEPAVERHPVEYWRRVCMGCRLDVHSEPAVLRYVRPRTRNGAGRERRPPARRLRRLGHDRSHQPGGRDQAGLAGPAVTFKRTVSASRTSTATAHAAATTAS